jgi:hypothetical protein
MDLLKKGNWNNPLDAAAADNFTSDLLAKDPSKKDLGKKPSGLAINQKPKVPYP